MALNTYSSIYYLGSPITDDNKYLDFKEGVTNYLATLNSGGYSHTELMTEVKRAMDAAGGQTYTVSMNRATRIVTISASSVFSLLVSSGTSAASSVFGMLGFTGSDRTGSNTYSGNVACGYSYLPQFKLQSHIASDDWQEAIDAKIHESTNGNIEVVSFGTRKFVQFEIMFATNITQASGGPIVNNSNGVADLRQFMQYIIKKYPVELNPDKDTTAVYETLVLESTDSDNRGIGYKLKEMYDRSLPFYFSTGILKFRVRV